MAKAGSSRGRGPGGGAGGGMGNVAGGWSPPPLESEIVYQDVTIGADPGSSKWALGALGVGAVLVFIVVLFQQFTMSLESQSVSRPPPEIAQSEDINRPTSPELAIAAKIAVKMRFLERTNKDMAPDSDEERVSVKDLDDMAPSRVDRLHVAAVAGELEGKDAALTRLKKLVEDTEKGGDLASDVAWMLKIYQKGPDSLPQEARESLVARHGWYGQLAISFGKHDSDTLRWSVVSGGEQIGIFFLGFYGVMGLAMLAGFVLMIVMGIKAGKGELEVRLEPPEPGGSVYLEMFAAFAGLFMLVLAGRLVTFGMGIEQTTGALAFMELLTWGCAAAVIWPKFRGVEWEQIFNDLGLTTGEGVAKEIGCGVIGWLAGMPLMILAGIVSSIVALVLGEDVESKATGGFPLFKPPEGNGDLLLVMMVIGSVIWAPMVEELMFRGALQRHLCSLFVNTRLNWIWACLATTIVFGMVHPYSPSGMVDVAFGGIVLSLLRQWRGSLIPGMVAHALHNGTIALVTVATVKMLGE